MRVSGTPPLGYLVGKGGGVRTGRGVQLGPEGQGLGAAEGAAQSLWAAWAGGLRGLPGGRDWRLCRMENIPAKSGLLCGVEPQADHRLRQAWAPTPPPASPPCPARAPIPQGSGAVPFRSDLFRARAQLPRGVDCCSLFLLHCI